MFVNVFPGIGINLYIIIGKLVANLGTKVIGINFPLIYVKIIFL